MLKLQYTITLESFLLVGSGEGATLIDSDCTYDVLGLPCIKTRRIKGALRESALEVLEMLQLPSTNSAYKVLESLFGRVGKSEGILSFDNAYIDNYIATYNDLLGLRGEPFVEPEFVKQYFTQEVMQTALDEEEIALGTSLRNYRALKPGLVFCGEITAMYGLTDSEKSLLSLALINLRYIGSRRNKGLGKVKFACEAIGFSIDEMIAHLKKAEVNTQTAVYQNIVLGQESAQNADSMFRYAISTVGPLLLTESKGDPNTVYTDDCIGGAVMRGLVASVLAGGSQDNKRHKDKDFWELVLSGNVRYGTGTKDGAIRLPLSLHQVKRASASEPIVDVLASSLDKVTRPIGGYGHLNASGIKKASVMTEYNFHNSRGLNRLAGTNKGAGIFYYEAISPFQRFEGEISGPKYLLEKLKELLENHSSANIGRSRTAQYGKVGIEVGGIETQAAPKKLKKGSHVYILAKSPLLLLNEHGVAVPSVATLQSYLGSDVKVKTEIGRSAVAKFGYHESYNSQWKSKSQQSAVFEAGSVFVIECLNDWSLPTEVGEQCAIGYGKLELLELGESLVLMSDSTHLSNAQVPNSELGKKLIQKYQLNERLLKAKEDALKDLKKGNYKISNSLIGRLLQVLTHGNREEMQRLIRSFDGKIAAEQLERAKIYDDLKQDFAKDEDYPTKKAYWTIFFKSLRTSQ